MSWTADWTLSSKDGFCRKDNPARDRSAAFDKKRRALTAGG
jgi:hypothetical protein